MLPPQNLGGKETKDTIVSLWEGKMCWISEAEETKRGNSLLAAQGGDAVVD
jgi:hypothetical protein